MATEEQVKEEIEERQDGFGESTSDEEETTETDVKEEDTETSEESSTSESDSETSETKEGEEEESAESDDLDEILPKKKTGVQKRIDRLTAEKHQLEARLKVLEDKSESKKERSYSEEELVQAERKAIADNDIGLLNDVNKERIKNMRHNLEESYRKDKEKTQVTANKGKVEWQTILESYSPDNLPEVYKGNPDYDVSNTSSKLYRIAKAYFEDSEMGDRYKGEGGMFRAVADAFMELVKIGDKKKKKSPNEKKLERKLAKAKMKTQLDTGTTQKSKGETGLKETGDPVKDFIAERRAAKAKAVGPQV